MSYATVAEADARLSYLPAWAALDTAEKVRRLDSAGLYLNVSYDWPGVVASCPVPAIVPANGGYPYTYPSMYSSAQIRQAMRPQWPRRHPLGGDLLDEDGCPLLGVPVAVKFAEIAAAASSLVTPLFATPAVAADGGLTKKRIKAGSVEIERQWSEPLRGAAGEHIIRECDAYLERIAVRRGTRTGRYIMAL